MENTLIIRQLDGEAEMLAFAGRLARHLAPGLHVDLSGPLGAGKTTLVRGMLRALGHAGTVRSPTYALVESYALPALHLHHFDFYRFADPGEWREAGLDEYFGQTAVCLVEWPEMARPYLPAADLRVDIALAPDARRLALAANSDAGGRLLAALAED